MNCNYSFTKDPDAVLDYTISWSSWLNGDSILTSLWIIPNGIEKDNESFNDDITLIWLSGGVLNEVYELVNRVTTSGGRTDDRSIYIKISEPRSC